MQLVLTILVIGILNIVVFYIGAKIGQTVVRGDKIETPNLNPAKAINEHKESKKEKAEQDRLDTIMRNIERYDGTSNGQEDVR